MTHEKRLYEKGYSEMTLSLRRQATGLETARHCLVSREATITDDEPFNKGGTDAVRAYIRHLEKNT